MASNGDEDPSQYIISRDIEISLLDCKTAFSGLSEKEKLYAHYLCRAAWEGSLICLLQTSPESPAVFLLLQHVFNAETAEELRERALVPKGSLSKEEFEVSCKKKMSDEKSCIVKRVSCGIDHFTVVGLVAWPLNESEAGGDLVVIETSLLFLCKFLLISMRTASLA